MEQAIVIDKILQTFCYFFGQKVNVSKSQNFFSANTPNDIVNGICNRLGFNMVDNLGIYLGMPLLHNRMGVGTFNFLVDEVRQRLSGWEVRKLSMVRRISLVHSILLVIPNYFMNMVKVPVTVCMNIERLAHTFIWGSTVGQRKLALVS